ncbi:MAG: helix-turn-helix domain-containing protein [Chloroflexota bacterium]
MNIAPLIKFWPLMHSIIREFWNIIEGRIEAAAAREEIPIELYLYSEFGLDYFSTKDFQKRDPFSNPEKFEKNFARLNMLGWVEPLEDGSSRVTDKAQESVRRIICAGDERLAGFASMSDHDLGRLVILLKQITTECKLTRQPPEKWAIFKRFRVAHDQSPLIVQVREYLMDMYAYRDDSHLSAARPHFNAAGIVWLVLGALAKGDAVNAEQMADAMSFRGYEVDDYEIAIEAAVEIGWVEPADRPKAFRLTQKGKDLREAVERLTNEYFYTPWSVLTQAEIDELFDLLITLRHELTVYRKSQ